MARVYYLRHQVAGVLWQYPFAPRPTEAQVAAVKAWCDTKWPNHPKAKLVDGKPIDEQYVGVKPWLRLAIGDDNEEGAPLTSAGLPTLPKPGKSSDQVKNIADANAPKVSGRGTVTNPNK